MTAAIQINADWSLIPPHMRGAVVRYFDDGIPPGDFLSAVLCNDLREACARADETNRYLLFDYIKFFYSYAPSGSWGSPDNFETWINKHAEIREAVA